MLIVFYLHQGGYVVIDVSEFVCLLAGSRKTNRPIVIKFGGKVEHWSQKKRLDFVSNLGHTTAAAGLGSVYRYTRMG